LALLRLVSPGIFGLAVPILHRDGAARLEVVPLPRAAGRNPAFVGELAAELGRAELAVAPERTLGQCIERVRRELKATGELAGAGAPVMVARRVASRLTSVEVPRGGRAKRGGRRRSRWSRRAAALWKE
jgi:hypothetical protein